VRGLTYDAFSRLVVLARVITGDHIKDVFFVYIADHKAANLNITAGRDAKIFNFKRI